MIEVSLLGRVSVAVDGVPLTGEAAQRRRLALLALLCVPTPRPLSRDRAMLYLWPDSDTASARHLLSVAVHVLRRSLGHEALVTTADEISLAAGGVRLDVAAFEEALRRGEHEEALRLYQGPFMDGFHAGAGPELEHWVDEERTRLEHAYAQALEGAAAARRAAGDVTGAVDAWRRRVLLDPYSSHGALGLMRALADAGDRAGAIRHAGVHRQLLEAELGAAPDPEVEALSEALRAEATAPADAPVLAGAGVAAAAVLAEPRAETGVSAAAQVAAAPAVPEPDGAVSAEQPLLARAVPPPRAPVPGRRLLRRWREVALGVLLVALTIFVWDRWRARAGETAGTLVVMPCDNTSPGNAMGDMGAAIANDIRDALGNVRKLQVVSRTSSEAMRHRGLTAPQIGDSLRAQWVLECNLRLVGDSMELEAAVVSARDGYRAWSRTWSGPSAELLGVREEVARGVAGALHVSIDPAALAEGGTQSWPAYEWYKAGQAAWYERTPRSLELAGQYFRRALAVDANYARAWAGLALTLEVQGSYDYGSLPPDSAFRLAQDAARHALALAPRLADAHLALASIHMNYEWHFAEAEQEFRNALEQEAGNSTARQWYALMLVAQKKFAAAREQMLRSGETENSAAQAVQMAHFLYYAGDYERSLREAQQALTREPAFPRAYMIMAMAQVQRGEPDSAAAILETLRAHAPEPAVLGALGYAYARAGQRARALECRDSLVRAAQRRYVPAELLVLVDVGLGDLPRALSGLQEAYDHRSNGMIYLAVEPAMAPLRTQPRFLQLVRDVAAGGPAPARARAPGSAHALP